MLILRVCVATPVVFGVGLQAFAQQSGSSAQKETVGVPSKDAKVRKQNPPKETKPPKDQRQAADGNSSEKGHRGSTGNPDYSNKHSDPIPRGSTPKQ